MKLLKWLPCFLLLITSHSIAQQTDTSMSSKQLSERFSQLALSCIHKEYPNIIKHMMTGPDDVKTPKQLYPAFYGCFDWHSSVHGHWLLVRLVSQYPELANRKDIIRQLSLSFTVENINGEVAYFNRPNTGTSFERPYGLAWFLQLTAELREWNDPIAKEWLNILKPLEDKIVDNITTWLPKLAFPIRVGEHSQTAFAFGLIYDWSIISKNLMMEKLISEKIAQFYLNDENCPLPYEPSGQDFLSPCIAEADLMRRVLSSDKYAIWLTKFLPNIPIKENNSWLEPAVVVDKSDGKLAHLDGVNLSRAWMLEGIAAGLPKDDPRKASILSAASQHKKSGINSVVNDLHYMGSHWLGSFATYLETKRGL